MPSSVQQSHMFCTAMAVAATSSHSGRPCRGSRCIQMAITAAEREGFSRNFLIFTCWGLGSTSWYLLARKLPRSSLACPVNTLNRQGSVLLWVGAQLAASRILSKVFRSMGLSLYCWGNTLLLLWIRSKIIGSILDNSKDRPKKPHFIIHGSSRRQF